jgi:hypothetical protein
MQFGDEPLILTTVSQLQLYADPKPCQSYLVVEIRLEHISLADHQVFESLLGIFDQGVTVSRLELINSKLGDNLELLFRKIIEKQSCIHLSLHGSCRRQSELDSLALLARNLKSINISTHSNLDMSIAITEFVRMNMISRLELHRMMVKLSHASTIRTWLASDTCSIQELTIRSCSLGIRHGQAYHEILLGISENSTVVRVDLSCNEIAGDTPYSLLNLLLCRSLKHVSIEQCIVSPQVYKIYILSLL